MIERNIINPDLIENEEWRCLNCNINERANIFPFGLESNYEINCINISNSMKLYDMIPEFEVLCDVTKIENLNSNDIDENLATKINCKYYSTDEIVKFPDTGNSFDIFHSNVNGYESHSDNIHEMLVEFEIDFNVICISETSQQIDEHFSDNSLIKNYSKPYFTETKTQNGGVAIFVKINYDAYERLDLKILEDEYEAVWVEIKNNKSKNIIVGCTYRHPHNGNLDSYISYMQSCLNILNKENKEVYITGDFNIDLLKYDTNHKYQEFYNLMTGSGYLPQIILPTRITDTTMSIIDNIYTNTFTNEIIGGNILMQVTDHLCQFISVRKRKITIKNNIIYKRSYDKFNEESFLDDLSIQNWNNDLEDTNKKFDDFIWRLTECTNRLLLLFYFSITIHNTVEYASMQNYNTIVKTTRNTIIE